MYVYLVALEASAEKLQFRCWQHCISKAKNLVVVFVCINGGEQSSCELLSTVKQPSQNTYLFYCQTNVYPKAQKRKMAHFEGFHRKAVVIVPSDEEFKNRFSKKEKEEGKWVPETAVNEMKGRKSTRMLTKKLNWNFDVN